MIKKYVSAKSIIMFRALETIITFSFLIIINLLLPLKPLYRFVINIVIIFIYLIIVIFYEKRRQRNTFYYIYSEHIELTKGVIFKYKTIIKMDGIQAIEFSQNIFQKVFNLYTVHFYTAVKSTSIQNIDKIDLIFFEKMSDNLEF